MAAGRQPVAVIQLNSGRHILPQHARNYLWDMARSHSFIHFVSGPCTNPSMALAALGTQAATCTYWLGSDKLLRLALLCLATTWSWIQYTAMDECMNEWMSECYSYFDFMSDMRAHTWTGEDDSTSSIGCGYYLSINHQATLTIHPTMALHAFSVWFTFEHGSTMVILIKMARSAYNMRKHIHFMTIDT